MKSALCLFLLCLSLRVLAQTPSADATKWVDSVLGSLNEDQKIAQLIVLRMSAIDASSKRVVFYEKEVSDAIQKYNVGGICLFQGGPLKQASLINDMQALSKTPLLISIDGENGLGMRMDSVTALPHQMMLGA